MSITESKRISLKSFWAVLSIQIRHDLLIIVGQPMIYNLDNVDISAPYLSTLNDWNEVPEDTQEKIYNFMVKL